MGHREFVRRVLHIRFYGTFILPVALLGPRSEELVTIYSRQGRRLKGILVNDREHTRFLPRCTSETIYCIFLVSKFSRKKSTTKRPDLLWLRPL
jgi:hypothetical protein